MRYIRQALTPAQKAKLEHALREIRMLEAKADYIAMMADVDLSDILSDEAETEAVADEQEI